MTIAASAVTRLRPNIANMTTSTATVVEARPQPPKKLAKATAKKTANIDETDEIDELPRPLQRSSTIHNPSPGFSHRHRHSKKLSLSFPVVPVPVAFDPSVPLTANGSISSISQSPSIASPYRHGTPFSGTNGHGPIPSPEELHESGDGLDFLTLIAGQERRVMELKEELHKAEGELLGLKKQWSVFEAKKKQSELRSKSIRMSQIGARTNHGVEGESGARGEDDEVERMRRREAREKERKMRDLAIKEAAAGIERTGSNAGSGNGKGKGGRVFAGGHTRKLSLLQGGTAGGVNSESAEGETKPQGKSEGDVAPSSATQTSNSSKKPEDQNKKQNRASLTRQPTLQELISNSATGAAQMNLGKTYKELAQAGRKSLPPGTDEFVKQGKQVYDGLNQGFWNFVEDIRQATVGDEPVNGPPPVEQRREVRQKRSNKKLAKDDSCDKHGKEHGKPKKGKSGDEHKSEKDEFWKEFGVETPKNAAAKAAAKSKEHQTPIRDHESKSSTDSKCPPSLLADLMDVHDDDETWDNWPVESPKTQRRVQQRINIRHSSDEDDDDNDARHSEEEEDDEVADARRAGKEFVSKLQAKKSLGHSNWAELTS